MRRSVWTVVVAGGSGSRFGGPKQFAVVAGRTVVAHSVDTARRHSDGVVVVVPADVAESIDSVLGDLSVEPADPAEPTVSTDPAGATPTATTVPVVIAVGGDSRAASVRAGVSAIPADVDFVLVHDAARPAASDAVYRRVLDALDAGADAVIPVVDVADTLRRRDGAAVDRDEFVAVQTPQGFSVDVLRAAHSGGGDATDDATLVERAGGRVVTVAGERHNLKITEPGDALMLGAVLSTAAHPGESTVGR